MEHVILVLRIARNAIIWVVVLVMKENALVVMLESAILPAQCVHWAAIHAVQSISAHVFLALLDLFK